MNIKLKVNDVNQLLLGVNYQQIYPTLSSQTKAAGLLVGEPQTGAGYLQWSLPGGDWLPLSKAEDAQHDLAIDQYNSAVERLAQTGGIQVKQLLSVPGEDMIFFRQEAGQAMQVALAAWGYKYPSNMGGGELVYRRRVKEIQQVRLGFIYDEQMIPKAEFHLNTFKRQTAADGFFNVGELPVGQTFDITDPDGGTHQLKVEKDRQDYVFDLTRYFNAIVSVTTDGLSAKGQIVQLNYAHHQYTLTTDEGGRAEQRIPLLRHGQDACNALCAVPDGLTGNDTISKTPATPEEVLTFNFTLQTVKPEPEPEPEPEPPVPEPEPKPEPEPEMVVIRLLDYGGYPLPELPFTLKTKKKGKQQLTTDDKGECLVPKEWFSNKEKMNVSFKVTREYQQLHPIHYEKDKK